MKKTAAEFFAGIGLVRMAFERAGWQVVFANDIDARKLAMYRDNFGGDHFVLNDIRNIRAEMVPTVSLATASFPCIDLSLAGNRNGLNGSHSSAYWEFHRVIKQMHSRRPPNVLLENVVGLITSNRGQDLKQIIASLNELGYSCDIVILDAVHFVPQSRPRLFVTGRLDSGRNSIFNVNPHDARPERVVAFIRDHPELKWGHAELPPLPAMQRCLDRFVERLGPDAPHWWDKPRQRHLYEQMSPSHRKILRFLVEGRNLSFATVYKRVRPAGCRAELRADGIAGCLRTPRGGSSKQFLVQAGQGDWRVRNMTAREYARLQGVPDSFKLNVPYNQALWGFGDAVCVPAVEWVVKHAVEAS